MLVNAYVDMFDVSVAKVFAGACIAQVKEKASLAAKVALVNAAAAPAGSYPNNAPTSSNLM